MGQVTPSQVSPNDQITAASVNTPINQITSVINGGIDSSNIADSSITPSKVTFGIKTTDANGWTVFDYGTFKTYSRTVTFSIAGVGTGFTSSPITSVNLPVGFTNMAAFGSNYFAWCDKRGQSVEQASIGLGTVTGTDTTLSAFLRNNGGNGVTFILTVSFFITV